MSMLTKAAARFDAAFSAQPPAVKRAALLAIYRYAPALRQYQADLQPLAADPEIAEACWDLIIGIGFQVVKRGRDAFGEKTLAQLRDAAPVTAEFMGEVMRLLDFSAAPAQIIDVTDDIAAAKLTRLLGAAPGK